MIGSARPEDRDTATGACANCGRPTGPSYCGYCGQEVETRRGPLLPVVRELLDEWLSLDSRLLRTLRALLRPGRLTRRYLHGHKARYLRPFRLYLLASLALFSSALSLRPMDVSEINLDVAGERVHTTERANAVRLTFFPPDKTLTRELSERYPEHMERLRSLPPQELVDSSFAGMRRLLPLALISFVPFLALALKLLYVRQKVLYVDHLIFALHYQSALFLSLGVVWALSRLFRVGFLPMVLAYVALGFLMVTVYLYLSLRRVHRQRRWITALKAFLLLLAYGQLLKLVLGTMEVLLFFSL